MCNNTRYWCQKVLPLIYDESLSYYEALCKLTKAIEALSKDLDMTETEIKAEVQNYLNEYFSNLTEVSANHYITNRSEAQISSQEEFETFMKLYRSGLTSNACSITKPGVYTFPSDSVSYAVANGIQLHIYGRTTGITIDTNGTTFYTSHMVFNGVADKMLVINSNTKRATYFEGGTTLFTNCRVGMTARFWGGMGVCTNCEFVTADQGTCIDSIAGVVSLHNCVFSVTEYGSEGGCFGIGNGGKITLAGRITIAPNVNNAMAFIVGKQNGAGVIEWAGSCVNMASSVSFTSNTRGNFAKFCSANSLLLSCAEGTGRIAPSSLFYVTTEKPVSFNGTLTYIKAQSVETQ